MNRFGNRFSLQIFGESHGKSIGITIDGMPPGILISEEDLQKQLDKRKPGKKGTTSRKESDKPEIISGIFNKRTSGMPITVIWKNEDARSEDYEKNYNHYRPGHADFTASQKFKGFNDYRGGGHFSGRMTLALVAAGYFARLIIPDCLIKARIDSIGGEKNYFRLLEESEKQGDTLGGTVLCTADNIEIGLGEPFFYGFESALSHLLFSIPGVKGVEFGDGFEGTQKKGSDFCDHIISKTGETSSNHNGGINGGITNGNQIKVRVAFKPSASLQRAINTFNAETGKIEPLRTGGRHDSAYILRTPIIVESVVAVVLADFFLMKA